MQTCAILEVFCSEQHKDLFARLRLAVGDRREVGLSLLNQTCTSFANHAAVDKCITFVRASKEAEGCDAKIRSSLVRVLLQDGRALFVQLRWLRRFFYGHRPIVIRSRSTSAICPGGSRFWAHPCRSGDLLACTGSEGVRERQKARTRGRNRLYGSNATLAKTDLHHNTGLDKPAQPTALPPQRLLSVVGFARWVAESTCHPRSLRGGVRTSLHFRWHWKFEPHIRTPGRIQRKKTFSPRRITATSLRATHPSPERPTKASTKRGTAVDLPAKMASSKTIPPERGCQVSCAAATSTDWIARQRKEGECCQWPQLSQIKTESEL